MKKLMKITLLVLCIISFVFPFISSAIGATTQGDTTFGVDKGDFYRWTFTSGPPSLKGFKYNLTIEDIYNGSHLTIDSYIIDATLGFYNKTEKLWHTLIIDSFLVAANETLDFVDYASVLRYSLFYFIIPTPINLTMIGEYSKYSGTSSSYVVSEDQLTLEDLFNLTYILTFNSDGLLIKSVVESEITTVAVLELDSGGGEDTIPFGYFFMIFILIGVISLVYLIKRKTK
jgi:hypothetical protein